MMALAVGVAQQLAASNTWFKVQRSRIGMISPRFYGRRQDSLATSAKIATSEPEQDTRALWAHGFYDVAVVAIVARSLLRNPDSHAKTAEYGQLAK